MRMRTVPLSLPQWMLDGLDEHVKANGGDRSFWLRYALTKTFVLKPPAEVKEKFWQEFDPSHK